MRRWQDVAVGGYGNDFMTGEADSDYLYGDGGRTRSSTPAAESQTICTEITAPPTMARMNSMPTTATALGPTIHDFLQGFSPNNESVWADDADSILLDVPAETPTLSAGPTTGGRQSRPTRP